MINPRKTTAIITAIIIIRDYEAIDYMTSNTEAYRTVLSDVTVFINTTKLSYMTTCVAKSGAKVALQNNEESRSMKYCMVMFCFILYLVVLTRGLGIEFTSVVIVYTNFVCCVYLKKL